MSIFKRWAMAVAVVALIAASLPTIIGSGYSAIETGNSTTRELQHAEGPRGSLVVNSITAEPTLTPAQVVALFQQEGLDPSIHADGTYEDPHARAERIAGEVNLGLRAEADVRQALTRLAARRSQGAELALSKLEIREQVRRFFDTAGVRTETPVERTEDRLERIASQIASGERTLAEVEQTILRIAAGTVIFNPDAAARFGGRGGNTVTYTVDAGADASIPVTVSQGTEPDGSALQPLRAASVSTTTLASVSTTTLAPVSTTTLAPVTTTTQSSTSVVSVSVSVSVSGGVVVFPGDSIQGAVNAHPAGTRFVIKAGVHRRQSVQPKNGNVFVGESGAVLTGENATQFAFYGSGDNVTITGLVVEKYNNPQQTGAIYNSQGATGWVVDGNEIRYNSGIGLKAGSGWKVLNNYVHHNTQLGLGGSGSNILVQGNEIAYNNYQKTVDPFWGGGGTKWVMTRNLVVRDNFSHHNHGPGLWTDIDNDGVLYEGNRVEDNYHAGIKHEISYSAVIRNNTLNRNGFGHPYDVKGAGILVANSPNVEVYGNTLVGNKHGVGAVQHDRYGEPADWKSLGEYELRNLYVHDNHIEQPSGQTGVFLAAGPHGDKPLTSWNNRFQNNTYKLGGNPTPFRWNNNLITAQQWQGHGQDTNGTFK